MPSANFVLLEKISVGAAGAASVEFSGIPQTGYTDLVVKTSVRDTFNANALDHWIRFNGVTTNYTWRKVQGSGSATSSSAGTIDPYTVLGVGPGAASTANTFGNYEVYIPNYTSSNFKSISVDSVGENNATQAFQVLNAGLWSNTAAITSIQFIPQSGGGWAAGSTFYLYGVAKLGTTPAIVPYATGGDTIMTDGTYWYHTFVSSGTFTPQKALTCDYLVVAGGAGGGGGNGGGGGGGAGGFRTETSLLAFNTSYAVTVGAGGAAGTARGLGGNGSNSVFNSLTSTGGGGGGHFRGGNNGGGISGLSGGSGGGGGSSDGVGPAGSGGAASPSGQGNAGGNGFIQGSSFGGGGGGGAGAVGANATTSVAGNGGNGLANSYSGSSVTYAGGGGGGAFSTAGTGGTGGGGAGGVATGSAVAGTANTGGGGGAGGNDGAGAAGGSGIVVVRYLV
jgi:hypothetical protein